MRDERTVDEVMADLDPEVAKHTRILRVSGPLARPATAKAGVCTQCGGPVDTDAGWCRGCLDAEEDRRRGRNRRRLVRRPRRRRTPPDPRLAGLIEQRDALNARMAAAPPERTPENYRRRDALNDRIDDLEWGRT